MIDKNKCAHKCVNVWDKKPLSSHLKSLSKLLSNALTTIQNTLATTKQHTGKHKQHISIVAAFSQQQQEMFSLHGMSHLFSLPFLSQLLRKRHIGNDIVTIIFQEPGALPFTPQNIRSHFQHVFVIVRVHNPCSDNTCYRLALFP